MELKERDSKTVALTLNPISGVTYSASGSSGVDATPVYTAPAAAPGAPPPPPPPVASPDAEEGPAPKRSNLGVLFGLHLGVEAPAGTVPGSDGLPYDATNFGSSGVAYGLEGGFRFGRHFYVGLTLDHAALNTGTHNDLSDVAKTTSSTTSLGLDPGVHRQPR